MHRFAFRTSITAAISAIALILIPQPAHAAHGPSGQAIESADVNPASSAAAQMQSLNDKIGQLIAQNQAAADQYEMMNGQLENAKAVAVVAQTNLDEANTALADSASNVQGLARQTYMQNNVGGGTLALVDANGPRDFLDRAMLLDSVSEYRTKSLTNLDAAQKQQSAAAAAAKEAQNQSETAAANAKISLGEIEAQLATAKTELDGLVAKKATVAAQTKDSPLPAAVPPPIGGPVLTGANALPVTGLVTSEFAQRWGTMHTGLDISAPMQTPIYAPEAGTVMRAGEAQGFGLAIYIEHDNGDVTVYGHIDQYFVAAGQRVSAGQQIAAVGNRGFSTGPHLHFEVQTGMYGTRQSPRLWLGTRGLSYG